MRIAIIGAQGQLGKSLRRQLAGDVAALSHADLELTDADSVDAALARAAPDVVINAAAYNFVDRAEDEPDTAFAVNGLGPRNLAVACNAREAVLVHVSSDYVFSGRIDVESLHARRTIPYCEIDRPEPLSAYAVSKLAGEYFVRSIARRHFVLRTCGLFGETKQAGRGNFVETMLRLAEERGELRVVDDQRCTPTAAVDLAKAIGLLIETNRYGLYHATNSGSATWYEFACEIFRQARRELDVHPITTDEFGAKARRPCYSVLDTGKLSTATGFELPPWQDALRRYLTARAEQGAVPQSGD